MDLFKGRGWRAMTIAVCCCAMLLTVCQAQAGAQEEKPDNDALELRLSAYESKVCLRSSLTLMLEITNRSQEELKIHKQSLWREFQYRAVGSNIGGSSISCGSFDDSAENWIVLKPGGQYQDTLTYQLDWNNVFKAAGRYQISTRFSYYYAPGRYSKSAASNPVEFEIYDCAAK